MKEIGYKFRQQAPIDHYIVDFVCLSQRLIIEVDGGTHGSAEQIERDMRRQDYLERQGFEVLRVWNAEVYHNLDGVLEHVLGVLERSRLVTPTPGPSPQGGGELNAPTDGDQC